MNIMSLIDTICTPSPESLDKGEQLDLMAKRNKVIYGLSILGTIKLTIQYICGFPTLQKIVYRNKIMKNHSNF